MKSHLLSFALMGALSMVAFGCSKQTSSPGDETASTASASNAPDEGRGHRPGGDPAKFIERFDKNGDGKLETSELPDKLRERMADVDADKDGFITVEELRAAHQKRAEQGFARMDKNGDGALSADEVDERRWEFIKVADADGDGKVTFIELSEARASGKLSPPERGPGRGGPGAHGPHHRGPGGPPSEGPHGPHDDDDDLFGGE